jgi:hypothetical protein
MSYTGSFAATYRKAGLYTRAARVIGIGIETGRPSDFFARRDCDVRRYCRLDAGSDETTPRSNYGFLSRQVK